MRVVLELEGLSSQTVEAKLLRVDGSTAVVEGYGCPEEHYRLSDGRRVEDGIVTSWDFWRLSTRDRRRLRGAVKTAGHRGEDK